MISQQGSLNLHAICQAIFWVSFLGLWEIEVPVKAARKRVEQVTIVAKLLPSP